MAEKKEAAGAGKELSRSLFNAEELSEIQSFDDAMRLAAEKYGTDNLKLVSDVIGDGFKLLDNKDQLVDTPILLLSWDFHAGDFGEFVSIRIVTQDNRKYVVNDGSTGIRDQLMQYSAKTNQYGGLLSQKGLRRSDYEYEDEKGHKSKATTYYLDSSA